MNDKLYVTIKLSIIKYEFNKPSGFGDLFKYSKQFKHGQTFKRFVRIVQNMGVRSQVIRFDDGLKRVLVYEPANDRYIHGEIELLKACETCNGTGVVKKPIEM